MIVLGDLCALIGGYVYFGRLCVFWVPLCSGQWVCVLGLEKLGPNTSLLGRIPSVLGWMFGRIILMGSLIGHGKFWMSTCVCCLGDSVSGVVLIMWLWIWEEPGWVMFWPLIFKACLLCLLMSGLNWFLVRISYLIKWVIILMLKVATRLRFVFEVCVYYDKWVVG
jgi:hypothetical protein